MSKNEIDNAKRLLHEVVRGSDCWEPGEGAFQKWHLEAVNLIQRVYGKDSIHERNFIVCIQYGQENLDYPAKWDNWYQHELSKSFRKMLNRSQKYIEAIVADLELQYCPINSDRRKNTAWRIVTWLKVAAKELYRITMKSLFDSFLGK